MDSENKSIDPSEYYGRTHLDTTFPQNTNRFLPNSGFSNLHPFITSSTLGNGLQFPYSNSRYNTQPFQSLQSPADKSNQYLASRFRWNENTKPEFSFSSNSNQQNFLTINDYANPPMGTFAYKRKTKSPPPVPLKQHITEERMVEHMAQLHINSETQMSVKESEPTRERRLYMCEEMQRLQTESIIPIQILEKVQRPCTALIPWKPPIISTSNKETNNNKEEEEVTVKGSVQYDTVMDTGV